MARVRNALLTVYHGVQYGMTFLVLLLLLRKLAMFLCSGGGLIVLALLSGYITFGCYIPGDCPWWWELLKKRRSKTEEESKV